MCFLESRYANTFSTFNSCTTSRGGNPPQVYLSLSLLCYLSKPAHTCQEAAKGTDYASGTKGDGSHWVHANIGKSTNPTSWQSLLPPTNHSNLFWRPPGFSHRTFPAKLTTFCSAWTKARSDSAAEISGSRKSQEVRHAMLSSAHPNFFSGVQLRHKGVHRFAAFGEESGLLASHRSPFALAR